MDQLVQNWRYCVVGVGRLSQTLNLKSASFLVGLLLIKAAGGGGIKILEEQAIGIL